MSESKSNGGGVESYVQLFVYRVPKKNHEAFAQTQSKLASIFKNRGIIRSEFFLLSPAKPFGGFTDVANVVSAGPDDEVWLELEYYRDQASKDGAVAGIGKEPSVGPLFGQIMGLVASGAISLQGDFSFLKVQPKTD